MKADRQAARLHDELRRSGLRKLLLLELNVRPADSSLGLNGSAMIIANPPWRLDEAMREAYAELHPLLDPERAALARVEWLVGE